MLFGILFYVLPFFYVFFFFFSRSCSYCGGDGLDGFRVRIGVHTPYSLDEMHHATECSAVPSVISIFM